MRNPVYTEEANAWLAENVKTMYYRELAEAFNERYGVNLSRTAIQNHCQRTLGIRKDGGGRFTAGKKTAQNASLGTETIRKGKNGLPYIWVKVDDGIRRRGDDKGSYNRYWKAKHRIVWEEHYGEIPDWGVVVFLDGDTLNCDIDNLYLTTNAINGKMARSGWYSKDPELTKTALMYCEYYEAAFGSLRERDVERARR